MDKDEETEKKDEEKDDEKDDEKTEEKKEEEKVEYEYITITEEKTFFKLHKIKLTKTSHENI